MAVDTERRAKKTASRLDQALLLQPVTNAMSFDPLDHSPEVGAHATDNSSSIQSPLDRFPSKPVLDEHDPTSHSHHSSAKKRRSSKSKVPSELRRSSSTPHMRNLALGTSGDLSPTSNKPRNKLGYHRTSVACGHCRRRKIRCLLAPDDPQGRCANCIRLKKECNFYPVEHNPEVQRPQNVASKDTTPGHPLTPATSSPRHLPPSSGDKIGDFRAPFPGASSAVHSSAYGFQGDNELDTHQGPTPTGMPVQQPSFPYPHPIDTQWPPTTGYLPSSTVAESPSSSTGYWRQSPSTTNSVYGSESNVSGGHTPAAMSTSSTMSYGHPEGHAWGPQPPFQPPARSMSYGNIEGLQQFPGQGLGIQPHEFPRRAPSYPYPSTIDTNPAILHSTTIGGASAAPLSAPIVPNQQFYQQAWAPYEGIPSHGPQMQIPGRSMSGQWYNEPQLDRVQEEGAAPVNYGHQGMPYYSGP